MFICGRRDPLALAILTFWALHAIASAAAAADGAPPTADDPTDVAQNKAFLAKNPKYLGAIRTLIVKHGYECPQVTHLWMKEKVTPYGLKLEALCGPVGTADAYPDLHYLVYPDRLKVDLCKPFGTWVNGCD